VAEYMVLPTRSAGAADSAIVLQLLQERNKYEHEFCMSYSQPLPTGLNNYQYDIIRKKDDKASKAFIPSHPIPSHLIPPAN